MLQRILLRHLGGPSRIHLVGGRTGCASGRSDKVKSQNSEKAVRCQRSKKQTFMTSAIVDKLNADRAMHLLFGIRKIADGNGWPVFAEAVGENSIVEGWSSQINNRSLCCFQRTDALDVNGLSSRISNRYLNIAKRLVRVNPQVINQVWLPAQSRVGDLPVYSVAQISLSLRVLYRMLWIIGSMKPVPIHLGAYSRSQGRRVGSWHRDGVLAIRRVHDDLQRVLFARRLRPECGNITADKQ